MEGTYTGVFNNTMQKTNEWLKEAGELLGWSRQPQKVYLAVRATLHALRDRLPMQESFDLASQLPLILKGVYFDGWSPAMKPQKIRHKEDFCRIVEDQFQGGDPVDGENVIRAVFSVIGRHVTEGELQDIAENFPDEIRELWCNSALAAHQGR